MTIGDLTVLVAAWAVANLVFNNFEKHLSWWRRILKFVILLAILWLIAVVVGRRALWIFVALLALGQIILHAWWFPRNGINGLTAEPYEKYLDLIRRMKGGK